MVYSFPCAREAQGNILKKRAKYSKQRALFHHRLFGGGVSEQVQPVIDGAHHGLRAGPDLARETWVSHKQKQSSPSLGTTYRT